MRVRCEGEADIVELARCTAGRLAMSRFGNGATGDSVNLVASYRKRRN